MPNASNTTRVRDAVGGDDVTEERAIIAVQGPDARALLAPVAPDAAAVGRFRVTRFAWHGAPCVAAGHGLHGRGRRRGVRAGRRGDPVLATPSWPPASSRPGWVPATRSASKPACRSTATSSGRASRLCRPASAGSSPGRSPRSAARRPSKPSGRSGQSRRLRGIATEGRRPPRETQSRCWMDGTQIGVVTSGNFSPVLGHGIALAFLPPDIDDGTPVTVEVRGSPLAGTVVPTPFVKKG